MELKTYFAQDRTGNLIPSAVVSIYLTGTTTLASGLTTVSHSPLSNPFTADADGKIQFHAPDGIYDMQVALGSTTGVRVTFQCVDIEEQLADANTAADRAEDAQEGSEQALADFQAQASGLVQKTDLAANDGEKLIGVCPTIATLRTIEPLANSQRITLREYAAGTGKGGGQFRAVLDGSTYTDDNGTIIKTAGGAAWLRINADLINPLMFGALGDGSSNDTAAVQAAINAAVGRQGLVGTGHTYGVGELNVTVGVKLIKSLKFRCVVPDSGILLGSLVDTGHEDLVIDDIQIDANSNLTKAGILMSGMVRSVISNCRVYGHQVHADLYGIRIGTLSVSAVNKQNKIINNHITMPVDPTGGGNEYPMVGLSLISPASSTYGGIDINSGRPLWPSTVTTMDTVIKGNHIEGGTHGIAGSALFRVEITENRIIGNTHRNINLSGNCQRCSVTNNHLLEGGSSAVNMAWGCRWMNVTGNLIMTSTASSSPSDDAAIQMYKCVDQAVVSANTILGDWKYSVYMGANVTNVTVNGNGLFAGTLASIAVESDWVNTATYPLAIYSSSRDPNLVPIADGTGNINIGGNSYGGAACAIYMTATNGKALYNVNVHDEVINSVSSRPHVIYAYDNGTLMTDGHLNNIAARGATKDKYYLSRGRAAFSSVKNVDGLDSPGIEFQADSTTTPSAVFGPCIYVPTGTITNFILGQDGDTLQVRLGAGVTLVHNTSVMRLKGNVNAVAPDASAIITLTRRLGIWFETSRNF